MFAPREVVRQEEEGEEGGGGSGDREDGDEDGEGEGEGEGEGDGRGRGRRLPFEEPLERSWRQRRQAAIEARQAAAAVVEGNKRRAAASVAKAKARRRRRAAIRGAVTVLAGAVLWLVVAPLLAAGLYETAFVVTAQDWESKGPLGALPCWNRPLRTLALGVFLLHAWVYSSRAGTPRWVAATMRAIGVGGARGAAAAGGGGHGGAAAAGPEVGGGGGGGMVRQRQLDRRFSWDVRIQVCVCMYMCVCVCMFFVHHVIRFSRYVCRFYLVEFVIFASP